MNIENTFINTDNIDFIQLLLPEYVKRESLGLGDIDKCVIYTGVYYDTLREDLKSYCNKYISVIGPFEIDLTVRENLVTLVFGLCKLKKTLAVEKYQALPLDEFYNWLKRVYFTHHTAIDKTEGSIFDFYKSFLSGLQENLKSYICLLENNSAVYIESSLLTFLDRTMDLDKQKVSGQYLKLLSKFKTQFPSKKVQGVLHEVYKKRHESIELRILDLILELHGNI